jgi:hypothetical protein
VPLELLAVHVGFLSFVLDREFELSLIALIHAAFGLLGDFVLETVLAAVREELGLRLHKRSNVFLYVDLH